MRILVTGAAGFLGSHLCDRLLDDGHEVVGLDDLSTGRAENLAHLGAEPRFRFVEADVRDPFDVGPVARIYNLACPASPVHYQADAIRTTLTSVLGVHHGLELARRHGARFLQASTSEVYGDPEVHPQVESYRGCVNPIGPRACYDEGKRCAESLVMDHRRQHGVDVRVARIFNTYGPRMAVDDGRVVSNFVAQALRGQPLSIYGRGEQTRSFCYVSDLVRGLTLLMESDVREPVNLGNPSERTILALAEAVVAAVGADGVGIVHAPLPVDDPTRRCPDISAARVIGFEPEVALEDGIARTVAHFRAVLGEPTAG